MTLPEVLVDHKPTDLDEPWSIAFPLDHDALVEVDGERHDLPAGAVLVWTGAALDWYPADSDVRSFTIHGVLRWADVHEGGTRLWSVTAKLDRRIDEYWRREPDW